MQTKIKLVLPVLLLMGTVTLIMRMYSRAGSESLHHVVKLEHSEKDIAAQGREESKKLMFHVHMFPTEQQEQHSHYCNGVEKGGL